MQLDDKPQNCGTFLGPALLSSGAVWALIALAYSYL